MAARNPRAGAANIQRTLGSTFNSLSSLSVLLVLLIKLAQPQGGPDSELWQQDHTPESHSVYRPSFGATSRFSVVNRTEADESSREDAAVPPKTIAGLDQAMLEEIVGGTVTGFKTQHLATLWAGYGSLTALHLTVAPSSTGTEVRSTNLVVKRIHSPATQIGSRADLQWRAASLEQRARKVAALMSECLFYKLAAPRLLGAGIHVPVPLHVDLAPPGDDVLDATVIFSDLREQFPSSFGPAAKIDIGPTPPSDAAFHTISAISGFSERRGADQRQLSLGQRQAALRWLASFHAHNVNAEASALSKLAGQTVRPGPPWITQAGGFWRPFPGQPRPRLPAPWSRLAALGPAISALLRPAAFGDPAPPRTSRAEDSMGSMTNSENVTERRRADDSMDWATMACGATSHPLAYAASRMRPRTLLHGHFIDAHILCSEQHGGSDIHSDDEEQKETLEKCAALGFGYVGLGHGEQDLAVFLYQHAQSDADEERMVRHYMEKLNYALEHQPLPIPFSSRTNHGDSRRRWPGFHGRIGRWQTQFWLEVSYLDYALFEATRLGRSKTDTGGDGFQPNRWIAQRLERVLDAIDGMHKLDKTPTATTDYAAMAALCHYYQILEKKI